MVNDGYLLIKLLGPIVFTIICHSTYFMHISLILSLSALVVVDRAGGRRRSHSSNSTSTTLSLSLVCYFVPDAPCTFLFPFCIYAEKSFCSIPCFIRIFKELLTYNKNDEKDAKRAYCLAHLHSGSPRARTGVCMCVWERKRDGVLTRDAGCGNFAYASTSQASNIPLRYFVSAKSKSHV